MLVEAFVLSAALGRQAEPEYRIQCQFRENFKGCEQPYRRRHDDEPVYWTATSTDSGFAMIDMTHVFSLGTSTAT
jgi:hypothetical protein